MRLVEVILRVVQREQALEHGRRFWHPSFEWYLAFFNSLEHTKQKYSWRIQVWISLELCRRVVGDLEVDQVLLAPAHRLRRDTWLQHHLCAA